MNALLSVALIALASLTVLTAQDKSARFAYPTPDDPAAGMERWMKTTQAGPPHARLKELVGDWETTMRMYPGGPGSKPMESHGTSHVSWLVEGKWIANDWSGTIMGMPTRGHVILGYDNFKQRYVSSTIDSLQTSLNTCSGLFDQSGDDLILWGTIDEPITPEQDKTVKYVYRGFGRDTWSFEVHDMMKGETDTKVYEVEYRRKK